MNNVKFTTTRPDGGKVIRYRNLNQLDRSLSELLCGFGCVKILITHKDGGTVEFENIPDQTEDVTWEQVQ